MILNQCPFSAAPARMMPSTVYLGHGGTFARSPMMRCRTRCVRPAPYAQTLTTKKTATKVSDTLYSIAEAAS